MGLIAPTRKPEYAPPDAAAPPPAARIIPAARHSRGAAFAPALAVALVLGLRPQGAVAHDLASDALITETVASRDRRKTYDSAIDYGAAPVASQEREQATPEGLRIGNYFVFPGVAETIVFDDNLFRSSVNKAADIRFETAPSLRLRSALPRHVLDLSLDGRLVNHLEHTDQDYANVRAALDGALHFDHAHTLSLSVLSMLDHLEAGTVTDAAFAAAEPTRIARHSAAVGITRDVGRLYATWSASVERWDYSDSRAGDGSLVDQDPRDTDRLASELRVGYRFSPGYEFIGNVRALRDDNRGSGILDHDATGYEAIAGLLFETNPLLRWRLTGGYGIRDYENDSLDDIASVLAEAEVQWLATQFITVTGSARRAIATAEDVENGGVIETRLAGRIDYEIWHDIVLKLGVDYRIADYTGIDRGDTDLTGRLGLEFYPNKNWMFTMTYEHTVRESDLPEFDMTRNRVLLGAKLRF